MKKSKLILSFAMLLFIVVSLAGCNKRTTENTTAEPPVTTTAEEPPVTTTEEEPPVVSHLENFVRELQEGAQTRNYNENFDELLEDFSSASAGNLSARLRVVVDNLVEAAPKSEDASIYKMATGNYQIETFDGIGFRMRKVGEGTLDLSNLVLGLRGDDAWKLHEINLGDALDADGDNLPELTDEFQDIIICPTLSIDDDSTEYLLKTDSSASGTQVLNKILGFHLYLTGECAQVIEIEEVFLVKGADKTTLDNFSREKVNKADSTCWWRDSTGFIVQKGQMVKGAEYTIDLTGTTGANLVLSVMGDTTGASLGGVSWANLKDANGNAVAGAVNGAYHPLVINLEKSGLTRGSLVLTSTTDLCLSLVFVSDLNDKAAVTTYPVINSSNVSMFDNFNRTQSGFDGDYEKSAADPIVTGAGLYYALSYNNGSMVSIADGVLTFDATELAAGDYINFKEGKAAYDGEHYLVLVVKATDGANFNDFRFNVGNGVTYINQMFSAYGLPLPQANATDYVYTDENGFMWLVIDLAESKMEPADYIDFYYSGSGKLLVDCVFYADEVGRYKEYTETLVGEQGPFEVAGGYIYSQGFSSDEKLVKIEADEGITLESLRIEGANGDKWFKDGQILDEEGNAISEDQELNGLAIIVDLEASGLNVGAWNHIHAGAEGVTGSFSYKVEVNGSDYENVMASLTQE